jgi:hypothetical protein
MFVNSAQHVFFGVYNGGQNITGGSGCPTLAANTWYHLAGTYDGTTIRLYVNGAACGTPTTTSVALDTSSPIQFANSNPTATTRAIDDVRIYNRALSAAEITTQYQSYNSALGLGGAGGAINLGKGLVGEWSMNGNAKDTTPFSGNGTVSNATLTTDRKGSANSAYSFNGTNAMISIPDSSALDFGTGDFTESAWVKSTATQVSGMFPMIINKAGAPSGFGFDLMLYASTSFSGPAIEVFDGVQHGVYTNVNIRDGVWHSVVGVRSGSTISLYVDGSFIGSSGGVTGSVNTTNTLDIGGTGNSSGWANASIDDVRLYNRALSAAEIAALYRSYK